MSEVRGHYPTQGDDIESKLRSTDYTFLENKEEFHSWPELILLCMLIYSINLSMGLT